MSDTSTNAGLARSPQARLLNWRDHADRDPADAADAAWAWIVEAGRRIQTDRDSALADLGEMFAHGRASTGIDGPTDGILVGFVTQPLVDRLFATVTTAWMPWVGKRFDQEANTGDNLLAGSARWPSKLVWPLYRMRRADGDVAAFDFETRVEPGVQDPNTDVLVIDYAAEGVPASSNPAVIIKSIRDELVELVPGTHLGKMLWRTPSGGHHLLAYFALRSQL